MEKLVEAIEELTGVVADIEANHNPDTFNVIADIGASLSEINQSLKTIVQLLEKK
jgi:hypothetical protein